jgi:hypothetical protein
MLIKNKELNNMTNKAKIENLEQGTVINMNRNAKYSYQTRLGVVLNSRQAPEGMKKVYQMEYLFDSTYKPALIGNNVDVEVMK